MRPFLFPNAFARNVIITVIPLTVYKKREKTTTTLEKAPINSAFICILLRLTLNIIYVIIII